MPVVEPTVALDLNDPDFQSQLFALEKEVQRAAMETFRKIRQLSWTDVYRDAGLKWEKIARIAPAKGVLTVYSLRITRARRATAYRDGNVMRLLTIAPDHDSTYDRK